jgi:hypothetical protein
MKAPTSTCAIADAAANISAVPTKKRIDFISIPLKRPREQHRSSMPTEKHHFSEELRLLADMPSDEMFPHQCEPPLALSTSVEHIPSVSLTHPWGDGKESLERVVVFVMRRLSDEVTAWPTPNSGGTNLATYQIGQRDRDGGTGNSRRAMD